MTHDGRRRAAAVALAAAIAALLVALPAPDAIVLGRPGDAPFLTGFGPRAIHRGLPGRWTGGAGRIDLPAAPLAADVTLHLQPLESRAPETVDVFVDGARAARVDLGAGRGTIALRVPPCPALSCGTRGRIVVQSAPWRDAASGETRGVFVSRVAVERGGWRAPPATWMAALALGGGVVAAAFALMGSAVAAWALAAWVSAALVLFRLPLAPWWPWLALAAWTGAAVRRFFNHSGVAPGVTPGVTPGVAPGVTPGVAPGVTPGVAPGATPGADSGVGWFGLAALGLIVLLMPGILRGEVFGQPQMLSAYQPWRAYLPATWEPRPTAPLGDVPMLVLPFLAHARDRLLAGDVPLWTASLNGGQPFLGAYQAAIFSPLTWASLPFPLPQATVVLAFLRLLVGGVGMFVFVRGLGLSRGAAAVAGTACLLNPFTVIWLEHPPGGVPPFLPWMMHAGTRAAEGRRFAPAGLALATALVLLGGHPHTGLFCALLGSAWAAAAALARADRWRAAAVVVGALALGAALAAIQIAPFLEYLLASRGYAWRQFAGLNPLSAPPSALIAALVPRFLGEHFADTYAGPLNFLEQTMYAGVPVLILAALGLAAPRRDWRPWFFAATATIATLAVYGAPGVLHVISALPLVKGATLTRIPIVAITSAIVVAAFGVDALRAHAPAVERRRALLAAAAAAAAIAVAILATLALRRSFLVRSLLTADAWRWSLWALLLAAGTTGIVAAFARGLARRRDAVLALTALVTLDLLVFGRGLHPTQPADNLYPEVPELARLRAEKASAGPFRVLGAKGGLMPNSALVYGLDDVRAYDGLGIAAYMDLLDVPLAWAPAHQQHEAHAVDSPILDLLGVRYLLAPPDFPVDAAHYDRVADTRAPLYRNRRELPRAFLVDRHAVATGNDARRRLRDGRDTRREVLLEDEPAAADRPEAAPSAEAVGTARITAYEHERVAIETEAPGRRLLVLTDAFFPGWNATVDGQPVAIARANFAFRAVAVPAGRHQVRFEYAPASFRLGATIAGTALLVLGIWTLVDRRRRV